MLRPDPGEEVVGVSCDDAHRFDERCVRRRHDGRHSEHCKWQPFPGEGDDEETLLRVGIFLGVCVRERKHERTYECHGAEVETAEELCASQLDSARNFSTRSKNAPEADSYVGPTNHYQPQKSR